MQLVAQYNNNLPLAAYLKNYFALHKKYGSTDRKQIAHLCFCYFRLGNLLPEHLQELRLCIAIFLCNDFNVNYSFLFNEEWLAAWQKVFENRVEFVCTKFDLENVNDIFCLHNQVNVDIDLAAFAKAHLQQPKVFARIRPARKAKVEEKLLTYNIIFEEVNDDCLSFENNIKLDEVLLLNKDIVVQDYSSQQISYFYNYVKQNSKQKISVWDCCAASGGKSILAFDTMPIINLTVSDIRESIINNLRKRFKEAGITKFHSFIADISKPKSTNQKFNFIICDAPCSGSGTWARTPENIIFFNQEKLFEFQQLQKNIATNAIAQLQQNGFFLYITCSVFTKENDDVIDYILQQHHHLKLIEKKYFLGFNKKADSMFGALFAFD